MVVDIGMPKELPVGRGKTHEKRHLATANLCALSSSA